jgi:3-isopropylmalate/(R)-2-methylmalate dehydratase small subunit
MTLDISNTVFSGRVCRIGDNVSTDHIFPSRRLTVFEPQETGKYALEGYSSEYPGKIQPGDILVAGENLGFGSSREQAPWALKSAGFQAVIAKSFARIFFRNCLNVGLLALTAPQLPDEVVDGSTLQVNVKEGWAFDTGKQIRFQLEPLPDFLLEYVRAGGLIPFLKSLSRKEQSVR